MSTAKRPSYLTEDLLHEEVGAEYLEPFFIDAVTEPVGLHVPAKRYICTVDKSYYQTLSRASKRSFELQGGFMSEEEKAAFEQIPIGKVPCNCASGTTWPRRRT